MKLLLKEEKDVCLVNISIPTELVVQLKHYSLFVQIRRVVAWILQFVVNCREPKTRINSSHLTVKELVTAKHYLVNFCQHAHFNDDIVSLQAKKCLPRESKLLPFSLFVDSNSVLHVGGRQCNTDLAYSQKHPAIIHRRHYLTRLIICSEYLCLLHAEPRLVLSSLSHWFQIIGMKKTV